MHKHLYQNNTIINYNIEENKLFLANSINATTINYQNTNIVQKWKETTNYAANILYSHCRMILTSTTVIKIHIFFQI